MYRTRHFPLCAWLCVLPCLFGSAVRAQDIAISRAGDPPAGAETYRLRVENTLYGRVEVSADGGQHYLLVGRVSHPATALSPDKHATSGGMLLRASGDGMAFSVTSGRALKLRPRQDPPPPPGKRPRKTMHPIPTENSALITNLLPRQGIFGELLPNSRTQVRLQSSDSSVRPFPEGYAPGESSVFVFSVALLDPPARTISTEAVRFQLETLAQTYADSVLTRAARARTQIVAGTLTLRAKLPLGEPEPIAAVTYAIDGKVVAAQNTPPYSYAWDTREAMEGEHVVEISAVNGAGNTLTRARKLLVVHNKSVSNKEGAQPQKESGGQR